MHLQELTTVDEFRRVVDLERDIWGLDASEDVVSVPVFVATVKRGGLLIGAFDGAVLIGFVYSFPGLKHGVPIQWSHMLGVADGWRRTGIGYRLKLAQRERTLAQGLDLVEWTFDPLQAPNAHLNLARLGGTADEYVRNAYGESPSPLHRGTPTDRLIVQWHLKSARVIDRLGGGESLHAPARTAPVVNPTRADGRWRVCDEPARLPDTPHVRVEIPPDFSSMLLATPPTALAWRMTTRAIFEHYLERGYRVADFLAARETGGGYYVLSRAD
jgi:predicted GNAT superfamily acetyltransferase